VPRESAVVPGAADALSIVIHADHIKMVKFSSRSDRNYTTVLHYINIMTEAAPERISLNWKREERIMEGTRPSITVSLCILGYFTNLCH
jgi:hypothetical protein